MLEYRCKFVYKNEYGVNSLGIMFNKSKNQSAIAVIQGFNWSKFIHSTEQLHNILKQVEKDGNKLYKIILNWDRRSPRFACNSTNFTL